MTTWYSKVKTYGRMGEGIAKRKVSLDGELDDVQIAAAMIGGFFNETDDVQEEIKEAGSVKEWAKNGMPWYAKKENATEASVNGMSMSDEEFESGIGNTREIALKMFDTAVEQNTEVSGDWDESLQISLRSDLSEEEVSKQRRSDRPLKGHAETAQKFLEVRKAIDEVEQQAAALRAIMAEKEGVAGNLASELMKYAEEYEDRTFRTKDILLLLQDIPSHKAKVPQWRKVIDHLLDKLGSVSKDMRQEGEDFIETAKSEIPGRTELMYQELEASVMGEAWVILRKLLDKAKGASAKISNKLANIEKETKEFLAKMEPDKPWTF